MKEEPVKGPDAKVAAVVSEKNAKTPNAQRPTGNRSCALQKARQLARPS